MLGSGDRREGGGKRRKIKVFRIVRSNERRRKRTEKRRIVRFGVG